MKSHISTIVIFCCLAAARLSAHPATGPYQSPGPHAHPTGTNVLVLFNAAWLDANSNGVADSREVADYYARRRAIPSNQVVALTITNFMGTYGPPYGPDRAGDARMLLSTNVTVRYDVFFSNIVVPVVQYLDSTNALTHRAYRDDILIICPVFGMPYYVDTGFADSNAYPVYSERAFIAANPEFTARLRSLDLMLCNVYRRYHGGIVWQNGVPKPGRPAASPYGYAPCWGDDQVEIGAPTNDTTEASVPLYFDHASDPATARHFAALRADDGAFLYESNGYFLVVRLDAPDAALAMALVDKAIYAERYLNNWAGQSSHPYFTRFYCGDDADFSGALFRDYFADNRGVDVKNWVCGASRGAAINSVFAPDVPGTRAPWDVVYDNAGPEIGEAGHTPRLELIISAVGSNQLSFTYLGSNVFAWWMLPPLEIGGVLSNHTTGACVTLRGTNVAIGTYWVDTTNGGVVGTTMSYAPPCAFPITDALFYTEYYTIDNPTETGYQYRDCWQWAPGAVALYNQSWGAFDFRRLAQYQFAGPALTRGVTATAGALAEPLTVGIPLVPRLLRALSQGFCWAEACYNSLYLAESWMTVFIGDPLYNPFIALWNNTASITNGDNVAPTLIISNMSSGIGVALDDVTPDEAADIAQFRLFAGYDTNAWSITNSYVNWPLPATTIWVAARAYGYARGTFWPVAAPASNFYYQVSARDPYGNETIAAAREFPIPEPIASLPLLLAVLYSRSKRMSVNAPVAATAP
jgi:hypothetical protein